MKNAERVQIVHSGGDVRSERDTQPLRHGSWWVTQQQLLKRSALHVLSECMQLTLVYTHTHKSRTSDRSIRYTRALGKLDKHKRVGYLACVSLKEFVADPG